MKSLKFILALILSLSAFQVSASHLMGGNITYECVGNNVYKFKAELYRDCNGITLPSTIPLTVTSASCGLNFTIILELEPSGPEIVTPLCPNEPDRCNGSTGVYGVQKYTYTHVSASQGQGLSSPPVVLPSCSDWVIAYSICCRNAAISTGSANSSFYIQTELNNVSASCNNSPIFGFDPILFGCIGDTVKYSHGVSDADNDSLVFSLTNCLEGLANSVAYLPPYSGTNPLANNYISLDAATGTLTFVPTQAQTGVICMLVEEYRNGVKIGEIVRDIQIGILNCTNQSPYLSGINGTATSAGTTGSNTMSICVGQNSCFTIDAYDYNTAQNVGVTYSNTLSGATFSVNATGNTAQVTICWTPTSNDIGTNHFGLSVYDNACPLKGKGNYTYIINVLGGTTGNLGFSDTTIFLGNSIALPVMTTDTNCVVTWSSSPTLSCTNCATPTATPTVTTTYYYQVNCPYSNCGVFNDSVTVIIQLPTTLQGVVTRHDGQPLDNSMIYAYNALGNVTDSSLTDVSGNYTFVIFNTSAILFAQPSVAHSDQLPTYYNGVTDYVAATSISLISGNTITVDFSTLPKSKTLQGTITRSDGLALDNSIIYLFDNNQNLLDSTITNGNGQYTINTLLDSVFVQAIPNSSHPDQLPTYYNSVEMFSTATVVTFTNFAATVDFSTLPKPHAILGTITRSDGLPLNNSWVHLMDTSMSNIDSILTTAQGNYAFIVPNVSIYYYVKATPSSNHGDQVITYYNGSETIQSADSISGNSLVNIANFSTIDTASATGGKSLGGTVGVGTDNFTPYPDVRLILKDATGNFINDAFTDDNGKFKFYGLSDGDYKIFVDKVGIDNELAPIVTLTANQPSQDTLQFLLHSYYLEMLNPNSTIEVLNVQNFAIYPNPIQTTFTIQYDLLASANVNIDILDVNGRVVKTLKNERQNAGNHQFLEEISKNNFANGIYFIRLQFDNQTITKRIIVKGQ